MIPKETRRNETSLVGVVQTLTDDVVSLFREHLALFRVELKRDTAIAARYAFALAFFAVISLMGFALLNLAAILFAGWAFGILGMAVSASVLCVIHLGFGLRAFAIVARRIQEDELGPRLAGNELERSRQWATKQVPNSQQTS